MLRREKALLWGQISEKEILMDLHILRSPESKHQYLAFFLYMSFISLTPKQITAESPNLLFYICIIHILINSLHTGFHVKIRKH